MLMGQWIVLNHRTRGEGKPPSTKTPGPGYDGAEERAFRYQNRRDVHGECGMRTTRRFCCCAVGYPPALLGTMIFPLLVREPITAREVRLPLPNMRDR